MKNLIIKTVAAAVALNFAAPVMAEALPESYVPEGKTKSFVASDGYRFEEAQFNQRNGTFNVVLYKNHGDIGDAYVRLSGAKVAPPKMRAFAQVNPDDGTCVVHMVTPDYVYDPTALGHEFMHCVFGNFHRKKDWKPK